MENPKEVDKITSTQAFRLVMKVLGSFEDSLAEKELNEIESAIRTESREEVMCVLRKIKRQKNLNKGE